MALVADLIGAGESTCGQSAIITEAAGTRDDYLDKPEESRMIQLGLGELELEVLAGWEARGLREEAGGTSTDDQQRRCGGSRATGFRTAAL